MNDIMELGQRWASAERRGDASALASMLTDDFMGVGPRGFVVNKAQWLERYIAGDLVHTAFTWDDVTVREHGTCAVVIGVQTQETTYKGQPANGMFRVTQIFVNEGGRWLLAGIHLSPMVAAPAASGR
jgi:ketosteroid isomerase-like protein